MEASCLELALEGERLCKAGDFKTGTVFFEAAVQVGTEDLKTLSAIYSQLGNAYFYLKEFSKALEYHKHDLTLARSIGDHIGEAKASGNLCNTLKILGQYDEAIACCQRHLDISLEQGDRVGEARALYNAGNVFHARGKQLSWNMPQIPGDLSEEVKETLEKATAWTAWSSSHSPPTRSKMEISAGAKTTATITFPWRQMHRRFLLLIPTTSGYRCPP
uniref:MGC82643 protein n=1 Tax=Xenopus laevis TaxID=8355 RepID=Q6DDN8_XENLA|nr:MGC82643 protein [Xenopus laevis]